MSDWVRTMLAPMQASWLKTSEAINFVRAANAHQATGIHDGQINARGSEAITGWLTQMSPIPYRTVAAGAVL